MKPLWILFAVMICGCQSRRLSSDPSLNWAADVRRPASAPTRMIESRDYDEGTHAAGAAYAAEHFMWHVPSPSRPQNDFEFYYKRCDRNGIDSPFMLKVEWACSEGPF